MQLYPDAGNIIAHVKSTEPIKIFTVRPTSFDKAKTEGGNATVEKIEAVEAQCEEINCIDRNRGLCVVRGETWADAQ